MTGDIATMTTERQRCKGSREERCRLCPIDSVDGDFAEAVKVYQWCEVAWWRRTGLENCAMEDVHEVHLWRRDVFIML